MQTDEPEVGDLEAADIRKQVARVLQDLGNPEPPLRLDDVMELLKLDLNYYSSSDLTLLDEIAHKVRVAGKQVIRKPGRILEVIRKARLNALWIPDGKRILIDDEVPTPKKRHIQAHEITHSITPWHRTFLLGDNELTLDPQCHAFIEAEANYGASQLLFLMERFASEARDYDLSWTSINTLKKRYGNTMTTTLWHMIEEREPDHPVIGLISRHPNHPNIGGAPDGGDCRHFIRSRGFRFHFPHILAEDIYSIVRGYAGFLSRGPIGTDTAPITDANGEVWEFEFESFSNSYDLLTFGVALRRMPVFARSA